MLSVQRIRQALSRLAEVRKEKPALVKQGEAFGSIISQSVTPDNIDAFLSGPQGEENHARLLGIVSQAAAFDIRLLQAEDKASLGFLLDTDALDKNTKVFQQLTTSEIVELIETLLELNVAEIGVEVNSLPNYSGPILAGMKLLKAQIDISGRSSLIRCLAKILESRIPK